MRISSGKRDHHSFQYLNTSNNYICSFCKKVLRCAQALGGHMNIHRTERARLKQLASINEESVLAHSQNQSKSLPTYMENQSIIRHLSSKNALNRNDRKDVFNLLDDEECVETSLSVGLPSKRQKSTIVCYNFIRSGELKIKNKSKEDIDLELRLGDTSAIQ